MREIRLTCTILFLSTLTVSLSGQTEQYRTLRRKVDSLERVIYTMKRKSAVNSLESPQDLTVFSRTGHYDLLKGFGGNPGEPEVKEGNNTVFSFPYPVLVERALSTMSGTQQDIWPGILGRYNYREKQFREAFRQNGLPEELSLLCTIESGCSQKALSSAGAAGYWQLMEDTARLFGLKVDNIIDERYDIDKSTRAAIKYLRSAYAKLQDWTLVVMAYNCGTARVLELKKKFGQDMESIYMGLPAETKGYVPTFLAAVILAENPEKYGITPQEYKEYTIEKVLSDGMSFREISKKTGIPIEDITALNPKYKQGFIHKGCSVTVSQKYKKELQKL